MRYFGQSSTEPTFISLVDLLFWVEQILNIDHDFPRVYRVHHDLLDEEQEQ